MDFILGLAIGVIVAGVCFARRKAPTLRILVPRTSGITLRPEGCHINLATYDEALTASPIFRDERSAASKTVDQRVAP